MSGISRIPWKTWSIACALLLAAVASVSAQIGFEGPRFHRLGGHPHAVVTGDFDGDGARDVCVASRREGSVFLFRNRGGGELDRPIRYTSGSGTTDLVVVDLDGESGGEIVAVNSGSDTIRVVIPGRRRPLRPIRVGRHPMAIVAGDFDEDGTNDVVTANYWSRDLSLLLGEGTGSFRKERRIATNRHPSALAAGDLDQDGHLDLVVANEAENDLTILLGRGNGTFSPPRHDPAGVGPRAPVVVEGAGTPRIAVVLFAEHLLAILPDPLPEHSGAPSLEEAPSNVALSPPQLSFRKTVSVGKGPVSLAAGDLDGDGKPDLVTANRISGRLDLLLGTGKGTFEPVRSIPLDDPGDVALGDLDGDGRDDIVVAMENAQKIASFLSHANPL
ncbi:MAG: VCBS repeat-containing protein [Deltaproteobacteria bacterium]|nr:MAG: VCBS repeat-containing protein [Deltaproteobacteria bacterium]